MKIPKLIYLQVCGECKDNECEKCNFDDLAEITWCKDRINDDDAVFFSEEHIREVADSLGMSGDAFIAQLNGISYAEWMKGGEK